MSWVAIAGDVANWSLWLWNHWPNFQTALGGCPELIGQVLENPGSAIRRVGNMLVFGHEDGGERVLGFVEQVKPQLDAINDAVTGTKLKLDVLALSQEAIASSLSTVQLFSVVSLGFTAILPVALFAGFSALRRHQVDLQRELGKIAAKIAAMNTANLETGLEHLRLGFNPHEENRGQARERLQVAHDRCLDARQYFDTLLTDELQNSSANRSELRLLARYYTVAARGVAGSHIGLSEDSTALSVIEMAETRLRDVSRRIFHETVGKDPIRFLLPPITEGGVRYSFMVDLYQQARAAGAIDSKEAIDATKWFEDNRSALFAARAPYFSSWRSYTVDYQRELAEAVAVVEEVNRLKSLGRMIKQLRDAGTNASETYANLVDLVAACDEKTTFLVWNPTEKKN